MGEKFKDFVYDFSDIILSLVIITVIFAVVSWKISDSMSYNTLTDKPGEAVVQKNEPPAEAPASSSDSTVTIDKDPAAPTTSSGSDGKPSAGATTPATTVTPPTNTAGTSTPAETVTPAVTPSVTTQEFIIEVPPGSSGYAIAKQLKTKGVISDTKMFITRVEQMKVGSKLKAGTFKIKAGMTLDEVINVLIGKK